MGQPCDLGVALFAAGQARPPPRFPCETRLRIHFMQQWFALSNPAMEESCTICRCPASSQGLKAWDERLPDESAILRLRHVLERHKLAEQILQTVNDLLSAKGVMLKSGTVPLLPRPIRPRTAAANATLR